MSVCARDRRFGTDGYCKSIPYSQKVPATAKTATHTTIEKNGAVWTWYHVDREGAQWLLPSVMKGTQILPKEHPNPIVAPQQQQQQTFDRHADERLTTLSGFHSGMSLSVAGNISEVAAKNADAWTGEVVSNASTATAAKKRSAYGGVFSLSFGRSKAQWQLVGVSKDASVAASSATLDTTVSFRLFSLLPLLKWNLQLLHSGPACMFATLSSNNVLLRAIFGTLTLITTYTPESAFVTRVDMTMRSQPAIDAATTGIFALLLSLLHIIFFPIRRPIAKLLLSLFVRKYEADNLPVYELVDVKPLSLRCKPAGWGTDGKAHSPDAAAAVAPAEDKDNNDKAASNLRNRAAKETSTSASASPAASAQQRRNNGYRSHSAFYSTFLSQFYSVSGVKKQDDMSW